MLLWLWYDVFAAAMWQWLVRLRRICFNVDSRALFDCYAFFSVDLDSFEGAERPPTHKNNRAAHLHFGAGRSQSYDVSRECAKINYIYNQGRYTFIVILDREPSASEASETQST